MCLEPPFCCVCNDPDLPRLFEPRVGSVALAPVRLRCTHFQGYNMSLRGGTSNWNANGVPLVDWAWPSPILVVTPYCFIGDSAGVIRSGVSCSVQSHHLHVEWYNVLVTSLGVVMECRFHGETRHNLVLTENPSRVHDHPGDILPCKNINFYSGARCA